MRKLAALLLVVLILPLAACTYPTEVIYEALPAEPVVTEPAPPPAPVVVASEWDIYVISAADEPILHDDCVNWQAWPSRERYRYDRGEAYKMTAQSPPPDAKDLPWRYVDGIIWYPGCGR